MRHLSNLLRLPASGWHAGLFAALVVFIATVAATQGTGPNKFTVKPLALPGANGLVMLDYFQYDNATQRL